MVPSALGCALIHGLRECDESLIQPNLRCEMEKQVASIAAGKQTKAVVLASNLATFSQKWRAFSSPAVFERALRTRFVNEAAVKAMIASSIHEQHETARQLHSGQSNFGLVAKADAKADIASLVASQMESARLMQQRQKERQSLLSSSDPKQQILGALFS
jgi:hypothetical protein